MAIGARPMDHRKVTYSLPVQLVDQVRQLVAAGGATSQSLFVSEALAKELRARRAEELREAFRQAAADPDFLVDIAETMGDFAAADAESARMVP